MKKLILLLFAAMTFIPAVSAQQADSRRQRQLQKECQVMIKGLQKAGWEVLGSSLSLENAVQNHFNKLIESDDFMEVYGTASHAHSIDAGVRTATNNAATTYAQQQAADLKGRITNEGNAIGADMDKFFMTYEELLSQGITGELKPSYQLMRKNTDETYEIEAYFIVNDKTASAVRVRAMESALPESASARSNAARITEYVKAGFKN